MIKSDDYMHMCEYDALVTWDMSFDIDYLALHQTLDNNVYDKL